MPPKRGLAEEYAALEAALRGTSLGRWFLAEYMRRNRTPETQLLLDAIARLEASVLKPKRQTEPAAVLAELMEMSEAIVRTRREIAQIRLPHQCDKQLVNASEELDQIVEATETATSEILSAAEDIQEVAWTLREKDVAAEHSDRLDQRTIDIYTACSFQDITGQRTGKVVRTLHFIEQRINAMIKIWGVDDIAFKAGEATARVEHLAQEDATLLNGPHARGEGLKQDDVDQMLMQPEDSAPPSEAPTQPHQDEGFERPEPLTLAELHAVKQAALFG